MKPTLRLTWHPEQRDGTPPSLFDDQIETYESEGALLAGLRQLFDRLTDRRSYCWDETVFVREPGVLRTHPEGMPQWKGLRIEVDPVSHAGEAALDEAARRLRGGTAEKA